MTRCRVIAGLVLLTCLLGIGRVEARAVDLELILAVDVSRSMDMGEQILQREGYVAAFRDPVLIQAVTSGRLGRIAVTYIEWAGYESQRTLAPWSEIDGRASAEAFALKLAAEPLGQMRRTSISGMLELAMDAFEGNGFEGTRRVIDISGDGPNNSGPPAPDARDLAVAHGITINGLPIITADWRRRSFFDIEDLDLYYEECVIGGPGAFYLAVTHPDQLISAIRNKLILEIAGLIPPARVIPAQARRFAPIDCLIGEKVWQDWMRWQE